MRCNVYPPGPRILMRQNFPDSNNVEFESELWRKSKTLRANDPHKILTLYLFRCNKEDRGLSR